MRSGWVDLDDKSQIWQSIVYVGNMQVDASWSLDRVANGIPGQSNSESRGGTGKLSNVRLGSTIIDAEPTPWNPLDAWPPRPGQQVTIDVRPMGQDYASKPATFRLFTGIVDTVTGGTLGVYEITITDDIDMFSRAITLPPLQRTMPPPFEAQGGNNLLSNLHQNWYIEAALRYGGFSPMTPPTKNVVLNASLSGSCVPNKGILMTASWGSNYWDSVYQSPDGWGFGMTDFTATYDVDDDNTFGMSFDDESNGKFEFAHAIGSGMTAGYTLTLGMSTTSGVTNLTVAVGSDRSVTVSAPWGKVLGPTDPKKTGGVIYISRLAGGNGQLEVRSYTPTYGVTLLGNGGTSAAKGAFVSLGVNAPKGSRPGSFECYYPPGDTNYAWQSEAYIVPHYSISGMTAGRGYENVAAGDILKAYQASTCTHIGIDEDGRAAVVPLLKRLYEPPTTILWDDTDIYDSVDWSMDVQNYTSGVRASYRVPTCNIRPASELNVWSGSSDQISGNQTTTTQIGPAEDWDWIAVDTSANMLGSSDAASYSANRGFGNVFGATVSGTDSNGKQTLRSAYSTEYTGSISQVTNRSWTITQKATTSQSVVTATQSNVDWLTPFLWGKSTPIIRAKATTQWLPTWYQVWWPNDRAPITQLDFGDTAGDNVQMVVDGVSHLLHEGIVQWEQLDIRPNPSIQLCDTIALVIGSLNVMAQGMASGTHYSFTPETGLVQKIDFLCIAHVANAITYRDLEYDFSGRNYSGLESAWGSSKYSDFEAAPTSK